MSRRNSSPTDWLAAGHDGLSSDRDDRPAEAAAARSSSPRMADRCAGDPAHRSRQGHHRPAGCREGSEGRCQSAPVVLLTANAFDAMPLFRAAREKHVSAAADPRERCDAEAGDDDPGAAPAEPTSRQRHRPNNRQLSTVPDAAVDALVGQGRDCGHARPLPFTSLTNRKRRTRSVISKGTDPKAGTLLCSAHLDHLGVRPDGTIMHGANDDASGTTAVLELAQALSSGKPRSAASCSSATAAKKSADMARPISASTRRSRSTRLPPTSSSR